MFRTLASATLLLAGHLSLSRADGANPGFVGQGYIQVLNGSDITKADPSNRLGCMSETGSFTLSDCAVFTKLGSSLASSQGNCTFHAPGQPANVDSVYGQRSYAWLCASGIDASNDIYYSFDLPSKLPLICHGNLDCYLDVKTAPGEGETLPLWEFIWGSQQMGITPGHTQAMWQWMPVTNSSGRAES